MIEMKNPVVELDGDEMARVLWGMIKDALLRPFIDLKTEYYDLGLPHRDETADAVTLEAAEAIRRLHVGVKCATITPNAKRMEEYSLHQMWKSPNGTIRAALDGTVFRAPILTSRIKPHVSNWVKPITIARHAYGDVYKAAELRVPGPGTATLTFRSADGAETTQTVYDFECAGVLQGQYNKDSSIESFARACFSYALSVRQDLWFSAKDTIAKQYDGAFRDIFRRIYEAEFKAAFGDHLLIGRKYLIEHGLEINGLEETEEDRERTVKGNISLQLRNPEIDNTHLNEAGYIALAQGVYEKGKELGYW